MAKVSGTLKITANPGQVGGAGHFEAVFAPYVGRLSVKPVQLTSLDDLIALLMNLKIDEDQATRWAGKARAQGVVLIPSLERTEQQLRENGLLA